MKGIEKALARLEAAPFQTIYETSSRRVNGKKGASLRSPPSGIRLRVFWIRETVCLRWLVRLESR